MDNEGSDLILFFPLSSVQPFFLPQAWVSEFLCFHFLCRSAKWFLVGFCVSISCGDRQRSTVSGLRVLLDFRKFH
ncbi:hypothetical protein D8674_027238 [Pyrus ussuriensis x Pyrus communis]|uniref:Uncharacterized protein n=1 Tax=Pyrus ussuriensis x Pyrus communis TaxID=2448454 RepID=A0A5N5IP21_9ROSA|nr:hypothetical protein D8674_027238 [Pyrus ussuriensis x Pyrus communis]